MSTAQRVRAASWRAAAELFDRVMVRRRHGGRWLDPANTHSAAESLESRLLLATGLFQPQQSYGVGGSPFSVAVADVNADGKPDVITANTSSGSVSVLLGNGNGTFQAQHTFATGFIGMGNPAPISVAVADVNGDGKPDLVVANNSSDNVAVLLGNGNGTFQSPQTFFAVGLSPQFVAVGDVNGDNKPDLVLSNQGSNTVSVLLGNGNGTFQSQQSFFVGSSPMSVAIADVNGDGKPDVTIANYGDGTLGVLLGNGNGTFLQQRTFATGGSFDRFATVADVNGDGKPDLVFTDSSPSQVGVMLGNGNATFQSPQTFAVTNPPSSLAVADVNGDGKPDLIVGKEDGNALSVLLGNGNGTFQAEQTFGTGASPWSVAVADLNVDNKPDVVTSNVADGTASVLLAMPDTTPPVASITSAPNITSAGGSTQTITVKYTDPDSNVVRSSIGTSSLSVTGPGGPLAVTGVNVSPTSDAPTLTATYTVAAPGGSWTAAANGTYMVAVQGGQVSDPSGNKAAPVSGSFAVNIPVNDGTPPVANISSAPNITAAGGTTQTITVTYSDPDSNVVRSTIGVGDLTVTGPAGPLTITGVGISPGSDAPTLTATYTVAAPGGQWTLADNGTYAVTVLGGQVADPTGNNAAAVSGSFSVNIADTTPPVASITSAPNITSAGGATQTITVKYADPDSNVIRSTIGTVNLVVTGPGGTLSVTGVNVSPNSDAATLTATYTVAAPGGSWAAADNGTYTVSVQGGQVADATGNKAAAVMGTFGVSIGVSDATAPVASITSALAVTAPGGTSESIAVTYTDPDSNVLGSTIGTGNLTVTGPGGALIVTSVSVSPATDAPTLTATYTVAAPGGMWASADNGTYTITVQGGQVSDPAGNKAAAVTGSFTVNIGVGSTPPPIDTTFGNNGTVQLPFLAEEQATEADGTIVVPGHMGDPSTNSEQAVCEVLNADGSAKSSFGNNGMVTTAAGTNAAFFATLPLSDGSVICVGQLGGSAFAAKALANGTLDPTFGTGGAATPALGAGSTLYAIAAGPGGTVYVGGVSGAGLPVAARLTAGGALDSTFGTNGFTTINAGAGDSAIGALAVQPDGKIVATGPAGGGVDVMRLNSDGTRDTAFGTNGIGTVAGLGTTQQPNNALDVTEGLALQADGKIIVVNTTSDQHFGVARLNTDGSPDASFGTGGLVTTSFGGTDDADTVLVDPASGQIVVTGTTNAGGGTLQVAIAAYLPSGALDPSFGSGTGMVTLPTNVSPLSRAFFLGSFTTPLRASATFQPPAAGSAAKRLVVGSSGGPQNTSALQRLLLTSPIPDTSPLRPTVSGRLPTATLIAGRKGAAITQTVRLTNSSASPMTGSISLGLLLSDSPAGSTSDPVLTTVKRRINLKPGKSVAFPVTARSIPASTSAGAKFVVAVVTDPNNTTGVGASSITVQVAQPNVDLSGAFVKVPASAKAGGRATVTISVTQNGNVPVNAPLPIQLLASSNADGSGATSLVTITRRVAIPAGKTIRLSLPVTLPSTSGTAVFLVATLDPNNTLSDSNLANNTFVSATAINLT